MSEHSTTVLFADLAGSVQLYEALGDAKAKAIVVELQSELGRVVVESQGIVHEVTGDEIMCRFEQAVHAIECAASIHKCTADYREKADSPVPDSIEMRVGIHSGSAIMEGDRLFGDTINTAARIMSIAQAGQTITTQAVLDKLPPEWQQIAREFDETTLKGKSEPTIVYDFPWQAQDLTQIQQIPAGTNTTSFQLSYNGKNISIGAKECPASIGRAANSMVVVDAEPVSRRHVSIEYLRGRFVVSDKSTNGTYVYPDNGETIYLRREQIPLWGSGRICLGAPEDEPLGHVVRYQCRTS